MSHSIFGWDLPPGCRVSDIPGNRPEDEAWERMYETFWDKERLTKKTTGIRISDKECKQMDVLYNSEYSGLIDDFITAAIEYGMEIGEKQQRETEQENKAWDKMRRQEVRIPLLRAFFRVQRERIGETNNGNLS